MNYNHACTERSIYIYIDIYMYICIFMQTDLNFLFVRCLVQEVKSGVGALGLSSCSDLGDLISAEGVEFGRACF